MSPYKNPIWIRVLPSGTGELSEPPGVIAFGSDVGSPAVLVGANPTSVGVDEVACTMIVVGSHACELVMVAVAERLVSPTLEVVVSGGGVDTTSVPLVLVVFKEIITLVGPVTWLVGGGVGVTVTLSVLLEPPVGEDDSVDFWTDDGGGVGEDSVVMIVPEGVGVVEPTSVGDVLFVTGVEVGGSDGSSVVNGIDRLKIGVLDVVVGIGDVADVGGSELVGAGSVAFGVGRMRLVTSDTTLLSRELRPARGSALEVVTMPVGASRILEVDSEVLVLDSDDQDSGSTDAMLLDVGGTMVEGIAPVDPTPGLEATDDEFESGVSVGGGTTIALVMTTVVTVGSSDSGLEPELDDPDPDPDPDPGIDSGGPVKEIKLVREDSCRVEWSCVE